MNLFDLDDNGLIIKSYIDSVFRNYFKPDEYRKTSKGYNCKCPVCGDSKTNKRLKRGWILYKNGSYHYYCHNGGCNASMSASYWLKQYYNSEFKSYILELLSVKNSEKAKVDIVFKEDVIEVPVFKREVYVDLNEYNFVSILEHSPLQRVALKFCKSRNIPLEIASNFYIGIETDYNKPGYKYRNRLIIPFWKGNKVFYFQGRTLDNNPAKYINYDISKDENIVLYNKYSVDYTKPIIVLEGPIDSMFVDNSVAALSTNISEAVQEYLDKFDCYYLFDDDTPGRKKAIDYIRTGKSVFLWKKFIHDYRLPKKDKSDINDVCTYLKKNKFTFEELSKYFSNNVLDSMFI